MSNECLRLLILGLFVTLQLITELIKFLSSKGIYRHLMYTDFLLILCYFLKMMKLGEETLWV